mmetsp:Transcript_24429/g.41677  ORF Transcript_24429/g.41677 Transcript_24429/m.41677 type:complete len:94 (+) Transcript_24429:268-549(+)
MMRHYATAKGQNASSYTVSVSPLKGTVSDVTAPTVRILRIRSHSQQDYCGLESKESRLQVQNSDKACNCWTFTREDTYNWMQMPQICMSEKVL